MANGIKSDAAGGEAGVLSWIGDRVVRGGRYLGDLAGLVWSALRDFARSGPYARRQTLRIIMRQIIFTGVDALPVLSVIALLLGIIIITQAGTQLPKVGGSQLVGNIIVLVVIRELGPLLTAFIVVGRSGTAITTELGNMKVSQEVTALQLMGIEVTQYLVLTRLVGVVLSMLCLTFYFDAVAVLGGFLVAKTELTVPFDAFVQAVVGSLSFLDIVVTVAKSMLFGVTVAAVCCFHGLSVRSSYTEVPQQTTRAMINSVTMCLILDIMITFAAYF